MGVAAWGVGRTTMSLSWEMCQAVMANDQAAVEALMAKGEGLGGTICRGETIMHWAVAVRSRCSSQLLEFLWMAGAKEGVENDDGVTPLRTAIRNGKIPLANTLIQMGERLECKNGD